MSLLIDDRGHQPPLLPYFKPYAVAAEAVVMDSSDMFFVGNGPTGNVTIGIERKKINTDLISSIRTKKLVGGQLDGLLEYDYPMLCIEGIFRPGKGGELEVLSGGGFQTQYAGRQTVMYREVSNFLMTMWACGVFWFRTSSAEETAAFVAGLYFWFTKEWDEHKAHLGIYAPVPDHPSVNGNKKLSLVRRPKASLVTKMAAQLSGFDQKAWAVGSHFKSVKEMVAADIHDWCKIEGVGKVLAKRAISELHGEVPGLEKGVLVKGQEE